MELELAEDDIAIVRRELGLDEGSSSDHEPTYDEIIWGWSPASDSSGESIGGY
jgi:hypothetical protein